VSSRCIHRSTLRRLVCLIPGSTLGVLRYVSVSKNEVPRPVTVLTGGRGWTSRTPGHLHTASKSLSWSWERVHGDSTWEGTPRLCSQLVGRPLGDPQSVGSSVGVPEGIIVIFFLFPRIWSVSFPRIWSVNFFREDGPSTDGPYSRRKKKMKTPLEKEGGGRRGTVIMLSNVSTPRLTTHSETRWKTHWQR
jgi:hypothetical protein